MHWTNASSGTCGLMLEIDVVESFTSLQQRAPPPARATARGVARTRARVRRPPTEAPTRISDAAIDGYIGASAKPGTAAPTQRLQRKVPIGEPGAPVGTNEAERGGARARLVALQALDHDWHRASVTPTTSLVTDIPDEMKESGGVARCTSP